MIKKHVFVPIQAFIFFSALAAYTDIAHADNPMTIYGTFDRPSGDPATKEPEGSQFRKGLPPPAQSSVTLMA